MAHFIGVDLVLNDVLDTWHRDDPHAQLGLGDDTRALLELRRALSAAGLGGPVAPPPTHLNTVILKLTKACNYACTYCYDRERGDTVGHMSSETARAVVEEAIRIAERPSPASPDLCIIMHGGEPMLRFREITEIVLRAEAVARQLGKTLAFVGQTNLSRVNDEVVRFSMEHQIRWGVSLDGPPRLNDRFRLLKDGGGTYAIYERALERYPEFVRSCAVLSVITRNNQDEALEIARHFHNIGVPGWDWTLFQPIGMGRKHPHDLQFSGDRLVASWNRLFSAVEAGEFDGFRVGPVLDYLQSFVTTEHRTMCMRKDCGAARDLMSVGHDGTIDACDCIDKQGPHATLGIVQIQTRDSLERARTSEKASLIRSRNVELGQCPECIWLPVCGGTCFAQARSLHGVWPEQCALSMNAFEVISNSIAKDDALRRYWESVAPQGAPTNANLCPS